jgi:hypothetical protein
VWQETYIYDKYMKLCGDNHKIKWPLRNMEDLKTHDFCLVGIILHYNALETSEDD